jgi:hypothetical protein
MKCFTTRLGADKAYLLGHLQRLDAFWPQIVADLDCLRRDADTKRDLSFPLCRLGRHGAQRPALRLIFLNFILLLGKYSLVEKGSSV